MIYRAGDHPPKGTYRCIVCGSEAHITEENQSLPFCEEAEGAGWAPAEEYPKDTCTELPTGQELDEVSGE